MTFGKSVAGKLVCQASLHLTLILSLTSLNAQIQCTEVTSLAGINYQYSSVTYMGGGAAFFDFDNDGDEDIWIAGGVNLDVLFENDGNGGFVEIGEQAGLLAAQNHVSSGVITADLDNDGFRDVVVLPHIGHHPLLFKNNGNGTFEEISETAGLDQFDAQSHSGTIGDINGDGWLDIYIANYVENINSIYDSDGFVVGFDHECFENKLFINDGPLADGQPSWTFTEASAEYAVNNNGCALATTFTDFDLDADADLMIANDFGEWVTPNALYQNTSESPPLNDISQSAGADVGIYGMGIATGDFDQDQDLDYYITNLGRNVLLKNDGTNNFVDDATERGVEDTNMGNELATGWGTVFADVDNDTDLDLFVCNGFVPAAEFIANNEENKNRLFINKGENSSYNFEETALNSGLDDPGRGRGFACSDYDNDGDIDFLVINVNQHTSGDEIQDVLLFRNDNSNGNNWLKVKLEGVINNKDAFGSTIQITVNGKTWVHDYNGGYGTHASQHTSVAHFGMAQANQVESLIVTWPGGAQSAFENIDANQFITITEDGELFTTALIELGEEPISLNAFPNPFNNKTQLEFDLPKSTYVEFEIFDALGRKSGSIKRTWYPAGVHTVDWVVDSIFPTTGWITIRLKTEHQNKIIKILRTK